MSLKQLTKFITREQAIAGLHEWYICYKCGRMVQIFRLRQNNEGTTYTMACGCETNDLSLSVKLYHVAAGGHNIETFLTFETNDSNGNQIEHMTQWGRSFLTQYYQVLEAYEELSASTTISDTGGTPRVGNYSTSQVSTLKSNAGSTVAAFGMVVGRGSTANDGSTVGLTTPIANGSGANQLNHGATGFTAPSGSAPLSFTQTRTFTNNSGNPITIQEAGWACQSAGSFNFLLIRDLTGGVTVNDSANTTGTYTLSYTIA